MNKKESVLNKILEKHPSLAGSLTWNDENGCLEYLGKTIGSLEGNPLLHNPNAKKGNILLGKSVWVLFYGRIPKGKLIRNTCGNFRCHNPKHKIATKIGGSYRRRGNAPAKGLSETEIQTIRYFRNIPPVVLTRVFNIPKSTVKLIWQGKDRNEVKQPTNFKPNAERIEKVEKETRKCHLGLGVEGQHLIQARHDIAAAHIKGREADILWKFLKGVSIITLEKQYGLPRANIYLIRQKALLRIWRALGPREWIRKASKGKVETWDKSWPKLSTPRK